MHSAKRFLQIGLPLALQECLTQISFLALCAFRKSGWDWRLRPATGLLAKLLTSPCWYQAP